MTRTILIALALGTSTIAIPLAAQQASPGSAAIATVQAGEYAIELHHTRVQFAVSHMGLSEWYGDFTGVSGSLTLDPRRVAASKVDITIPVASVSTTNTKLDGELRSADWFDADRHPAMRFVSTSVVKTGARTARIAGNLTFHGVTRPVVLSTTFYGAGTNPMSKAYTVGFNATTRIKRSDFGVNAFIPVVGDAVDIRISAAFERRAG